MDWTVLKHFAIALVAIINPLGKIPLWQQATDDQPGKSRTWLALFVTVTACIVMLLALVGGKALLTIFGIELASFRIGGGILILLLAVDMLKGSAVRVEKSEEDQTGSWAKAKSRFPKIAVPIAVPLIAGPGTISTVMVYASTASSVWDFMGMGVIILLVSGSVFLMLLSGWSIEHVVGRTFLTIQTKVFALILAGIAIQFIVEGVGEVFPTLVDLNSVIADDLNEEPGQ
ncbi:MAG: MarC family protein [Desulfovibrionales bacterium]